MRMPMTTMTMSVWALATALEPTTFSRRHHER